MYWNNRVFRRYYDDHPEHEPYYTIHEVYYNENNEIEGYIADDKSPWGTDVDELKQVLAWMLDACDKPVIDEKELEEYFKNLPQPPEEEYEVFNSVEELLAALDSEENDADSPSGDTGP